MPHDEPDALGGDRQSILVVMVPGMGMQADDFRANGLVMEIERRRWPLVVTTIDPGADAYLDGSVETRLLDEIDAARRAAGASYVWLAGISLGCQGILRCVRRRPAVAAGLLLLTPYLANTGLIADVNRTGGLRRWAASHPTPANPEQSLITWLGTTPPSSLPPMLVGHAEHDRFATTALLLADVISPERMVSVPGPHDWTSWIPLWRQMLDRNPFGQPMVAAR
jgi:pimeloyl-ACP methyl ester carboxylesterase